MDEINQFQYVWGYGLTFIITSPGTIAHFFNAIVLLDVIPKMYLELLGVIFTNRQKIVINSCLDFIFDFKEQMELDIICFSFRVILIQMKIIG